MMILFHRSGGTGYLVYDDFIPQAGWNWIFGL